MSLRRVGKGENGENTWKNVIASLLTPYPYLSNYQSNLSKNKFDQEELRERGKLSPSKKGFA